MINYGTLETLDLTKAAEHEAEMFELPKNWREFREVRCGFTIDAPYSLDRDDAISLDSNPDGSSILHVSIADVGSFLANMPAVHALAQRRIASKYRGTQVVRPLLPRKISEDVLSLVHGKERPVLTVHVPITDQGALGEPSFTRDIMLAHAISYGEVNEALRQSGAEDDLTKLAELERVAHLLFAARHKDAQPAEAVLEDEDGNMLALDPVWGAGRLIVQECMIAGSRAVAGYMGENDIPTLYRVHNPQLGLENNSAHYDTIARPHYGLDLPIYMHITSPLRRYPDFANHCNLVAHLEGKDFPLPTERLEYISNRLTRIAEAERAEAQKLTAERRQQVAPKMGKAVLGFVQSMEAGIASEADLALVLFGDVVGTEEDIANAKKQAAQFIATRIHMARTVLDIASARNYIELLPTEKPNNFIVKDSMGNEYFYNVSPSPLARAIKIMKLLERIAQVQLEVEIPESMTREGKIMQNPGYYLQQLSKERGFLYRRRMRQVTEGDSEFRCEMMVVINGVEHSCSAIANSKKSAEKQAGAQLINNLDLVKNPPQKVNFNKIARNNPVVELDIRLKKLHLDPPTYVFTEVQPSPDSILHCVAEVFDTEGGLICRVSADGRNKKLAKQKAATALLEQIEPPKK